jgi:hypothetical protein
MTPVEFVDALVAAGESLPAIENRVIEPSRLDREARDALWLYAWAAVERRGRTRRALLVR